MKALTMDEVKKVLKVASESPRNHAMILLAFRHGMRASEVCGLRLGDVDTKAHEVVIRRLKQSLKTTQPMCDEPGHPLLSERRVLRTWLTERAKRHHSDDYVFTSQKGGKLDRTAFWKMFRDVAERAGLPKDKRHPHCLKHALGFSLVAANVNLASVRIALGHKNISSTVVYATPTDEQVGKQVASALSSLL